MDNKIIIAIMATAILFLIPKGNLLWNLRKINPFYLWKRMLDIQEELEEMRVKRYDIQQELENVKKELNKLKTPGYINFLKSKPQKK